MILLQLLKRLNYRTWLVVFLLGISISGAFYGFNDAVPRLEGLPWFGIAGLGILVGWAAERAGLKPVAAIVIFMATGVLFPFFHYGRLLIPLFSLERAWVVSVLGFFQKVGQWASTGFPVTTTWPEQLRALLPNPDPIIFSWREIITSINVVIFHLTRWLESAQLGERVTDLVGIGVVWSCLFWLATTWATYATQRFHNPLLGLAPLLLGQAFALNYVNAKPYSLLAVIFFLLMMTSFTRHFADERRWQTEKKDYADYLTQDTGFTAFFLTAFIVLAAFFASLPPLVTIEDIENFLNRFRHNEGGEEIPAARSLGLDPRPEPESNFSTFQQGGLPRQHLLGSGAELSRRVVMNVQIEEELDANEPSRTYYWRALTYDQYTGHGWSTSETQDRLFASRDMVLTATPYRSRTATARISRVQEMRGLLYAPGELISADHAFELSVRPVPMPPEEIAGRQTSFPPDIFAARIDARTYRVSTLLPVFSSKSLQAAASVYPEWIRERYLALPSELPDRLLGLVLELTAELPNSYAKVKAIEAYLRKIPYSLDIPAPDPFMDVVDYFIFEQKEGYCDYYATAMVVMSRVAGIPARLVVGYSNGNYDPVNRRYVVTEANAHSWVEVYFPGTGWIEFEPTAALPELQRPDEDLTELAGTTIPTPPSRPEFPSFQELIGWGIIAFIAVGGAILFWNTFQSIRLRRMGAVKGLAAIYKRLYRLGRALTGKISPGDTPLEFSDNLQSCLLKEYPIPGWKDNLPITEKSLLSLTSLYIQAIYSLHQPTYADLKRAGHYWKLLRQRIWLARVGKQLMGKKK